MPPRRQLKRTKCLYEYLCVFFREIRLGEHKISKDPDCPAKKTSAFRSGKKDCFAKVIKRKVDKVIKHENYDATKVKNDIALIRLAEPVPLFKDDPTASPAMPICLPWDDDLVARDLFEGKNLKMDFQTHILIKLLALHKQGTHGCKKSM